jgi:hypothetical protein
MKRTLYTYLDIELISYPMNQPTRFGRRDDRPDGPGWMNRQSPVATREAEIADRQARARAEQQAAIARGDLDPPTEGK